MEYNLDFIVIDLRRDKSNPLPKIEGISIYAIDTTELIETIEAKFNEEFL
jgi:hypothetical protein